MALATPQLEPRWCDVQSFCKQLGDCRVGPAVYRRSGGTNLQAAILGARYFVGFRTGVHANGDVQVVAIDPATGAEVCRYRPNGLNPLTTMVAAISRITAKIGEMSKPPMAGMMRLNGLSTGSVSVVMIAVAGL